MKKRIICLFLAVILIAALLPISTVFTFAEGSASEIRTLNDILDTVAGSYTGSAEWVDHYSHKETSAWITLNKDEYSLEVVSDDGESKMAVKTVLNHTNSRRWNTTRFDGYGVPLYDEDPVLTTENTIDDFLNTPIALTPFDMDAPLLSGDTVPIPGGSLSMDYFAFYDVQNEKTQKMYLESERMEFTRVETGPFTLRELSNKVGGTYSYAETFNDGNEKYTINTTFTLGEDEFVSESLKKYANGFVYGSKRLCNAEGTTEWDIIEVDASGKPVYGEPSFSPDNTIEDILNYTGVVTRYAAELKAEGAFGEVSVIVPAGSYYWEDLNCYFYGMQNAKTQNVYTNELVLHRTGDAVHEHIYSTKWNCNELVHWHDAICGHTDFVSGFGMHDYDIVVQNGITTKTCQICGYKKVEYSTDGDSEGEIITGVSYTGISLTLGSDIAINFYMELTDEAVQDGRMRFDIGGRMVENVAFKKNYDSGKYYFSTPLTALEMNENITATFAYNGVEYVQEYSVAEYIEEIVTHKSKYGDYAVALAKKIANYGYYAQIYLASIHTNVKIVESGKGYDRMLDLWKDDIRVADAKNALAKHSVQVTGTSENLSLYGSTVYFDSATALNYYVVTKDGSVPAAACPGKTVTVTEYKGYTPAAHEKVYIISVQDILATELADNYEVKINNGELTLTGSVLAYCNTVVKAHSFDGATEKDTYAVNAMAAFYEYYRAAYEYSGIRVSFDMKDHGEQEECIFGLASGDTVPEPGKPTEDGWLFLGWWTDEFCLVSEWDFAADTVTDNITLYAKWEKVNKGVLYVNVGDFADEISKIQVSAYFSFPGEIEAFEMRYLGNGIYSDESRMNLFAQLYIQEEATYRLAFNDSGVESDQKEWHMEDDALMFTITEKTAENTYTLSYNSLP